MLQSSMRVFFLPNDIKGIVFDIDGTLYSNDAYAASQEEEILKRFAEERALRLEEVKAMVEGYRRDFAERNGGRRPSLGNTFLSFGVSIGVSSLWREEVLRPELFLSSDSRLAETLSILSGSYRLLAVTNNPTSVGRRTLKALGVSEFFPSVIGLDRSGESKPAKRPFILASEELSLHAENLLSVGDRYEVDLEVPLSLGMGGILIEAMEDVYGLPKVLGGKGMEA